MISSFLDSVSRAATGYSSWCVVLQLVFVSDMTALCFGRENYVDY